MNDVFETLVSLEINTWVMFQGGHTYIYVGTPQTRPIFQNVSIPNPTRNIDLSSRNMDLVNPDF